MLKTDHSCCQQLHPTSPASVPSPCMRDDQAETGRTLRVLGAPVESPADLGWTTLGNAYGKGTLTFPIENASTPRLDSPEGVSRLAENIEDRGNRDAVIFAPAALEPVGAEESPFYRMGRWAAEHKEEVFAFGSDPINLVLLAVLLAAAAVLLMGFPR